MSMKDTAKPQIKECKQEVVVTNSWLIKVLEESQRQMKTLKLVWLSWLILWAATQNLLHVELGVCGNAPAVKKTFNGV
jgi:hypothetical protein